ncbi:acyltransferase [Lentzea sp. NPDC003310]|uniref:acyltransferase family protein n=1 Tax=Lentzea sp. NPDC003310 TaxID=3154447 RepID=UPI0033B63EE4
MSSKPGYMPGLDFVRLIASVAVVYVHWADWTQLDREQYATANEIEWLLTSPLHLNERLEFVGVAVFLLISGMVISGAAFRERGPEFLARRAVRLLPALWVAVLLAWTMVSLNLLPAVIPADLGDLFLNGLLVNYLVPNTSEVLGLTWTLAVQFVFYFYVVATMPLLKRWPWVPQAVAVTVVSVLISVVPPDGGPPFSFLRQVATFLPVLFIGQLIALVKSRKLPVGAGVALGVLQYLLFIRADLTSETWPGGGDAHARTLAILVIVVLLASRADGKLVGSRWVASASKRTYGIYLLHIPIGIPLRRLLEPITGYWPAMCIAIVVVLVATELMYRFVETPVTEWYRKRTKARSKPAIREGTRGHERGRMHDHQGERAATGDGARPVLPGAPPR